MLNFWFCAIDVTFRKKMATGIVKGEQLGEDALLAESVNSEPYPLPSDKEKFHVTYSNRLAKEDILSERHHDFSVVSTEGEILKVDKIKDNAFILADNFYGLSKLSRDFKNKIKLVYLDPPYGTGKDFQSRTLKHAYKDVFGTTAWLEFMRRRLYLIKELMTEDGSIYVHIGHQMLFHLKIVMDEVFGEKNFRNLITRRKCSSKNYTKNQYPNVNDYILFYSKSDNYTWNKPSVLAEDEWLAKEYNKTDEKGRFKLVPIHAPGVRNGETGKPWKGMMPPSGKHWQLTPEKLDALDLAGEIHWSKNGNPRRKIYLTEDKSIPITDYWDQYRDAHHQSIKITGYPTEKNLDMLKMIIAASSDEGDIVLDPFNGSGTTIHAANDLNRRWLGIDQSFTAAESTLRRLRFGLKAMGDYVDRSSTKKQDVLFLNSEARLKGVDFEFFVDSEVLEKHKSEILTLAKI